MSTPTSLPLSCVPQDSGYQQPYYNERVAMDPSATLLPCAQNAFMHGRAGAPGSLLGGYNSDGSASGNQWVAAGQGQGPYAAV